LLGFTFLAEPFFGLKQLSLAWTGGYGIYAALVAAAWFLLRPEKGDRNLPQEGLTGEGKTIPRQTYIRWLVLSALPSAYLLAGTNLFTLEIGSFPLTWVAPLALYLASFIVTFRTGGGIPKRLNRFWPEILLCALLWWFVSPQHFLLIIGGVLVTFFVICWLVHGHLYEMRPPENHLTHFYLTIAVGGWVGGAFVSILAPMVFLGLFEYPALLAFLTIALYDRSPRSIAIFSNASWVWRGARILVIGLLIFFTVKSGGSSTLSNVIYRHRNFYGIYRVYNSGVMYEGVPTGLRKLAHGMTLHGAQFLDPKLRMMPVSYYYRGGPIADVFETTSSPRRIAVIGLGSGVTAAFVGKEDQITFYEIDPDNEEIAQLCFTFWDACRGKIDFVAGDGRLSLQKTAKEGVQYDLIHIDAFSGDGIPTSLLTREALEIYLSRLSPRGIILFHVSNRNYELRPVVKSLAQELRLLGARNIPVKKENLKPHQESTKCVVLTRDPERLETLVKRGWVKLGENDGLSTGPVWTDEHINILYPLIENIRARLKG
jgi:hypothetical protein